MQIEDKNKIKKVKLKFPEYMSDNAEALIKKEYFGIREAEHELAELRMKVIELEQSLKERKDNFRKLSETFDLVFEIRELNHKIERCGLVISNSTDARYASYGQ